MPHFMKTTCDTKEKLLLVAFDLIWDSSYGSVSVDDICRRAGINKGSFYHFFKSKADLAIEAYEEHARRMEPVLDSVFASGTPGLEQVRRWCELVVEIQQEKAAEYGRICGCPYASLGAELATQDEKIRSRVELIICTNRKRLEGAISEAIRDGSAAAGDPVSATQRAYSVCLGMLVEAKVRNNLEVLSELEPAVMGILGVPAGPRVSA